MSIKASILPQTLNPKPYTIGGGCLAFLHPQCQEAALAVEQLLQSGLRVGLKVLGFDIDTDTKKQILYIYIHIYMCVCAMDEWMDRGTDARMHGCTDARMHARTHPRTHARTHACMLACTHAWMDGWMDGCRREGGTEGGSEWMDGWMWVCAYTEGERE